MQLCNTHARGIRPVTKSFIAMLYIERAALTAIFATTLATLVADSKPLPVCIQLQLPISSTPSQPSPLPLLDSGSGEVAQQQLETADEDDDISWQYFEISILNPDTGSEDQIYIQTLSISSKSPDDGRSVYLTLDNEATYDGTDRVKL